MTKEILKRAQEIEQQIKIYNDIIYAMTFPYQKFRLMRKCLFIGAKKYPNDVDIALDDKQLAKLIEDYCREKSAELRAELEAL